jgi:hypothetical protein
LPSLLLILVPNIVRFLSWLLLLLLLPALFGPSQKFCTAWSRSYFDWMSPYIKKAAIVSNRFTSDSSLQKYVRLIRGSARAASGEAKWAARVARDIAEDVAM